MSLSNVNYNKRESKDAKAKSHAESSEDLTSFINNLSDSYALGLKSLQAVQTPSKHREDQNDSRAFECVKYINYLWWAGRDDRQEALRVAIDNFRQEAEIIRTGWVYKPQADKDALPSKTGGFRRVPITSQQREELFDCLHRHLKGAAAACGTPRSRSSSKLRSIESTTVADPRSSANKRQTKLSDTWLKSDPIPIDALLQSASKRAAGIASKIDAHDDKRTCIRASNTQLRIEDLPVNTEDLTIAFDDEESDSRPESPTPDPRRRIRTTKSPVKTIRHPASDRGPTFETTSANTSFDSNVPNVFSQSVLQTACSFESTLTSQASQQTQENNEYSKVMLSSSYDDTEAEYAMMNLSTPSILEGARSRTCPAISGSSRTKRELKCDVARLDRLTGIFPKLSPCLEKFPFCVRYEVTRVYTAMDVPMDNLRMQPGAAYLDYDKLWQFLRGQPELKGKPFPQESDRKAWDAACKDYSQLSRAVVLSADLIMSKAKHGPLFNFILHPLRLDLSHRLGRRFGHDRFFEVKMSPLAGDRLAKERPELGSEAYKTIVSWLTREAHTFLGRQWRSFYAKDGRSRRKHVSISGTDIDVKLSHLIYLYAEDGLGFQSSRPLPSRGEIMHGPIKMTVPSLIAWLVHTDENKAQPYLKLFSRISLGLSKNFSTIVLDQTQIKFKKHDIMTADGIVMNDGCGQISIVTARRVAQSLGLGENDIPSGFQARLGGAKGFWIVDSASDKDEISVYPSQVKWRIDESAGEIDEAQRTFEVVDWVKPLRSASLNLQLLPILMEGATKEADMQKAIGDILSTSLSYDLTKLLNAMDSSETLRKWVRDTFPGTTMRIKNEGIPFLAGLPVASEEKANLLLESGFSARECSFLRELTRTMIRSRCDDLQSRLNIVVGQSCHAYIAVDFTGTLEADEVQLYFSQPFEDDVSGFKDNVLEDLDVLITRSPAHFPSDIQRVRAVFNTKLRRTENVILCSCKGDYPLAGKLSGGDYDGDIAWICWDQRLVQNFRNTPVPEPIDIVKMGYLTRNTTSYDDLKNDERGQVTAFLESSFEFNLEPSMLGICTNYKEQVTYSQNKVGTRESILLGNLLSYLVDAPKQGYKLSQGAWDRLKQNEIKVSTKTLFYKGKERPPVIRHIIDHLKFVVAHEAIQHTLVELNKFLGHSGNDYDVELVEFYKWAQQEAEHDEEWAFLLRDLQKDLSEVKSYWAKATAASPTKSDRSITRGEDFKVQNFKEVLRSTSEKYQYVKPRQDTVLTRLLLYLSTSSMDFTQWELLKASMLYFHYHRGKLPWHVAGKQLCALKAARNTAGERRMINTMYTMMKPDNSYVKHLRVDPDEPLYRQARAESLILREDPDDEIMTDE